MIKLEIFRVLLHPSSCGAVDNASGHLAVGHAFEFRSEPLFIKTFTYRRGRWSPHVQTVLTSLMSKLVKVFTGNQPLEREYLIRLWRF